MEISELDKELFIKYAKCIFGETSPSNQDYEDFIHHEWEYFSINYELDSFVFTTKSSLNHYINCGYLKHIKIVDLLPEFKKYLLLR